MNVAVSSLTMNAQVRGLTLGSRKTRSMKIAAYIVALVVALAYGCNQHQASDDSKESPLAAARAANEEIQLAMAESKCGDSEGPQGLCSHLKQAQADIDNTISRMNGGHQ